MHGNFGPRHSPTLTIYVAHLAVETIFTVLSYDAVSGQDLNLSPAQQRADAVRFTTQLWVKKRLLTFFVDFFNHSNFLNSFLLPIN